MLEKIELRIPEVYAKEFLDATDGVCLGGSVRKVEVHLADPRFSRIGDLDRAFQRNGKAFFTAWSVRRRYTPSELRAAKSLQLLVKRVFEPTGEQFGTLYDESTACHLETAAEKGTSRQSKREPPDAKYSAGWLSEVVFLQSTRQEGSTGAFNGRFRTNSQAGSC